MYCFFKYNFINALTVFIILIKRKLKVSKYDLLYVCDYVILCLFARYYMYAHMYVAYGTINHGNLRPHCIKKYILKKRYHLYI